MIPKQLFFIWIGDRKPDYVSFNFDETNPQDEYIRFRIPESTENAGAEIRAILKYAKLKIKILKYQLEPLLRIKKEYEKTNFSKRCSIPNPAIVMIDKEIKRLQDILSTIISNRDNLQLKLNTDIDTREERIKYILKKKEQKQGNK